MARAHPAWGCNRIETALRKQGISRSHNTVQNILNRAELGTQEKRWLDLDTAGAQHTAEQIEFIERFNPSYRDRAFRKTTPGALLFADAFKVGPFDSFSDGAIHVAIDSRAIG